MRHIDFVGIAFCIAIAVGMYSCCRSERVSRLAESYDACVRTNQTIAIAGKQPIACPEVKP